MPRLALVTIVLFLHFSPCLADQYQYPTPSQATTGLFGYTDATGKFVIQPQYEKALPFAEGLARVKNNVGWSVINEKGKVITKKPYHEILEFRNGVAIINVREYTDGKYQVYYGTLSGKGNEIIAPAYPYFTPNLNQTLFIVGTASTPVAQHVSRKNAVPETSNVAPPEHVQARFGVLDAEGKWVVPLAYEAVRDYNFKLFAVKHPDGHWQVFNPRGEELFKNDYTDIKDFDEEYATVRKSSRWGIIRKNGQIIKPLAFREIVRTGRVTYNLQPMPQWKVVDEKNSTRFAYEFEDLKAVNEVLYSYQLEGRSGLMTEKGAIITPPIYNKISPITSNMTVVQMERKYGVIDKTGLAILPNEYENILIDSLTGLIKARNGSKWGVYDKTGQLILPLRYDAVSIQPDGSMVACLGGRWGTTDAKGNQVIAFDYHFIGDFQYGKARAKNQEAMGVIDARGNWLVEPIFEDTRIINDSLCSYFTNGRSGIINTHLKQMRLAVDSLGVMKNGFILVKNKDKYGLYDQKGREIIPIQYDYISSFGSDSMMTVHDGDKKGLINVQGKIILKPSAQFQALQIMHEERAGIKINNRYGFIDKEGRLRIANRYEGITPFSENMAGIEIKGKWGFIDKAEQLRVQPYYDEVQAFRHGVAMVRRGKFWGFTDKIGHEVIKPQYDTLELLPTGRRIITKNGKKGLINEQGRELFMPKYDHLRDLGNGFLILGIKNKVGLYNLGNYDVVPILYDEIVWNPLNNLYTLGMKFAWQPFTVNP